MSRCFDKVTRTDRGFTLVELLVALALMTLVVLSLNGSLYFGARAWEGGNQASEELMRVRLVQTFLRRRIEAAELKPVLLRQNSGHRLIEGSADQFLFSALLPTQIGIGGYYEFRIFQEDDKLLLRWLPYYANENLAQDEDRRTTVLASNVANIEFAYADRAASDDRTVWSDQWDEEKTLPLLVRLRVEFTADARVEWPELVIKVQATDPVERRN